MYTFACLAVSYRPGRVPIEPLLAVMTVTSVRVVPAVDTHRPAPVPRQVVYLQVEPTLSGVQVTVARYYMQIKHTHNQIDCSRL